MANKAVPSIISVRPAKTHIFEDLVFLQIHVLHCADWGPRSGKTAFSALIDGIPLNKRKCLSNVAYVVYIIYHIYPEMAGMADNINSALCVPGLNPLARKKW